MIGNSTSSTAKVSLCLALLGRACVCAMDPWRSPLLDFKLRAMPGSRTSAWGLWHDSCPCLDLGAWELGVFNSQSLSLFPSRTVGSCLCAMDPWTSSSVRCRDLGLRLGTFGNTLAFALGAWELYVFNGQGLSLSRTVGSCLCVCNGPLEVPPAGLQAPCDAGISDFGLGPLARLLPLP